jgi:hypothetical protein
MTKQRYFRLVLCAAMIAVLGFSVLAQEKNNLPELSVSKIKLGDRASAKVFLERYSARRQDDGRPAYFFYNKFGTQVMKLTAASTEDPFFIMEIEVFAVDKSYQTQHYVAEKIGFFQTEKKIFIGYQQSAASMIIGLPGVTRNDIIGPKDVIKKKGAPTERVKTGDDETVTYNLASVELPDENDANKMTRFSYFARYEFHKSNLTKFTLKISSDKEKDERLGLKL